jgi:curved DNA-binding protein CbpA
VNYYDLLQVNKNTSQSEISSAFRKLIKQHHPDRYSDPEEKAEAEQLFQKITAAFNVLKDPEKRAAYDQSLDSDKDTVQQTDTKEQAQHFFKNGLHQLNNLANHKMAEEFFKKAVYLDKDNAKYLFYLATVMGTDPRKRRKAVEYLEKAVALDPFSANYLARIGTIYINGGMNTRAIKYFQKALKMDSSCQEAIDGLTSLGIVVSKNDGGKGFFAKLFGRK